jgi:hypothetical protein
MKRLLPIAAAVALVCLIAGLSLLAWKLEGRGEEDSAAAEMQFLRERALVAESLLPLVDRVKAMRDALQVLPPGSADYENTVRKLTAIQNVMASQVPELVESTDGDGNARIVHVDEARRIIEQIISGRPPE